MTDDATAELEDLLGRELFDQNGSTTEAPPEDQPEVVRDAPPDQQEEPEVPSAPTPAPPDEGEPEGEPEVPEEEGDPHITWATRKYGDKPEVWAKAAHDMEGYIQQLQTDKNASDELAQQWYQVAQEQEQRQQQQYGGMPLSAQEEQYVENSLTNPLEFARQAAFSGRVPLYSAVIQRVAEENPMLAAQIGTQVQTELQHWANQEAASNNVQPPSLEQSLGASFQRLGIDLQKDGPKMSEKLRELGEYHPYVRAILGGNDGERDLAVQAVHDLTRATTFNSRQVERQNAVAQEEQLRHAASVVQTGTMQPPVPPAPPSAFQQGMIEEWKRAGQWPSDEQ